jgi:flagellar hook assembly protein FlgD
LTIYYRVISLTPGKEPIIFRQVDNSDQWQRIGGAIDDEQQTVSTVINQLGRYGVMEMAPVQADSLAQLLKDSLTCQPRAFSPKGNTFNTETTISFGLDKPASATVKVYDVTGYLVRLLASDRILSEGRNALSWSGRDSDNEIVPTGAYIVAVTVGDRTETKVVSVYNR